MAASMVQRNCSRIFTKCKHVSIRRQPKTTQPKITKTKYSHGFLSYPKINDVAEKEKTPEELKTFRERVEEIKKRNFDPELDEQINIGYPLNPRTVGRSERRKHMKSLMTPELEKKTRLGEVTIDELEVQEEHGVESGYKNLHTVAEHYGVFKDLFGDAYFYPQLQLRVAYDIDEEFVNPVYNGNILEPSEVQSAPSVEYEFKPDTFYTLCLSCPDSHLQDNQKEYLHWLIGNIPGDSIKDGEMLCDYLQPFPIKGAGHHRYVFILYEQHKKLDFREDKRPPNCTSLKERTFHTYEFYRKYQDDMTPVSLAFFQSEWDDTVTKVFWDILDMKEPTFEFVPPRQIIEKQKLWPHKEPFHIYLDKYRDVKDLNEEVLKEKLKTVDPFKPSPPLPKYPNAFRIDNSVPSWRKLKIEEQRLRKNRWKDLDD